MARREPIPDSPELGAALVFERLQVLVRVLERLLRERCGRQVGCGRRVVRARVHAEAAIAQAPVLPAYARVDIVMTQKGPLIMELELIEPSLFFTFAAGSAERFARAILERIARAAPAGLRLRLLGYPRHPLCRRN